MKSRDSIALNEMVFYAYHGVRDTEKEQGQRFIINFRAELNFGEAAENDDLEKTVSYSEVYRELEKIFKAEKYDLLESAAYQIIKGIFRAFPLLQFIEVEIKKPAVPIAGILSSASVKMSRKRKEVESDD
ncbi:MAG: dihydroneopterin aldolase [Halanaerobium sp.]